MYQKNELHVMLDLETMGVSKNAVITRIAAVVFDINTGETSDQFSATINAKSSVQAGLVVDGQTIQWWLQQDANVIQENFIESLQAGLPLQDVLNLFDQFIKEIKTKHDKRYCLLWGNGASADLTWLSSAYNACHKTTPWEYWNERDVRTLVWMAESVRKCYAKRDEKFKGSKHDPLQDCLHQIKYVVKCMQSFEKEKITTS